MLGKPSHLAAGNCCFSAFIIYCESHSSKNESLRGGATLISDVALVIFPVSELEKAPRYLEAIFSLSSGKTADSRRTTSSLNLFFGAGINMYHGLEMRSRKHLTEGVTGKSLL